MSWTRQRRIQALALAAAGGFVAGVLAATWFWQFRENATPSIAGRISGGQGSNISIRRAKVLDDAGTPVIEGKSAASGSRQAVLPNNTAVAGGVPQPATLGPDPVADLRGRKLWVPIQGANPELFKGSFQEIRGAHMHEAVDILAPRNTPVLAVEDGKVARLFYSKAGGITVYQFDPQEKYVYYYAHLEKYVDNLHEEDRINRGQVIGYVGTSGNAPPGTPHLHFAIFRLTEKKHWWEGTPIDPYEVFK